MGRLDVRSNMGGNDNSFCVPAGAKKIKVTINMMEYSFKVEPVSIADAYYLVGGPGSWSSDKSQKFSHSSADVFEDPVFSYVFAGNGGTGDIWFAFGDADALDAIDNNDWMQLYGYKGDFGMSGSFERRSVLGGENTFHVDGTAKFYRFTVNMAEMTYEIVEMNFTDYIYTVGNVNGTGWDKAFPLYGPDLDGKYQGSYYLGSEFKFKPNADNWDGDWGQDPNGVSGKLVQEGEINCKTTAEGFYMIDVNLATMEYTLTPITKVCMVGGAVGDDWDNGVEMTYNTIKNCWECDATFTKADVIKFKGNGTWDTFDGNWGGTMDNIINGSNDNIQVTLSGDVHVEFYPSCNTRSYCTITQR